jgi:hypothetical protein
VLYYKTIINELKKNAMHKQIRNKLKKTHCINKKITTTQKTTCPIWATVVFNRPRPKPARPIKNMADESGCHSKPVCKS